MQYILPYSTLIGFTLVIVLSIIALAKTRATKKLTQELQMLKSTYNDLDKQAKLIIKTDLDLHKAQGELDKKITSLYTLQKISRVLSTTLDEEEIFNKVSEQYMTELGFDKAFALFTQQNKKELNESEQTTQIKYKINYKENAINKILSHKFSKNVFDPVINKAEIVSSFDLTNFDQRGLEAFNQECGVHSFVCAPITTKDGVIGALFSGVEPSYSPVTGGDKEIIGILAAQIGQSLENARLFEETWSAYQQLEIKVQQRTKELSKALEEIKVVTQRKTDFVSAVAHELRTPLTSIKGYAALLSAGKLGQIPPAVKERLEKINKHSDNLSGLINNLLDISRIESGRVEMNIEKINLKETVESFYDLLAPQFKEKQIKFKQDIPPVIKEILADKQQLQRVFINLVGNAIKFTPAGGTITIGAKETNDEIQIVVQDSGIGIPKKDLHKVFEEFYRTDEAVNQQIKGTGLGLSLVKYIVEAHKGKIWVDSDTGKGAKFIFALPLNPGKEEDNEKEKKDPRRRR